MDRLDRRSHPASYRAALYLSGPLGGGGPSHSASRANTRRTCDAYQGKSIHNMGGPHGSVDVAMPAAEFESDDMLSCTVHGQMGRFEDIANDKAQRQR
jgi:hypothetical protein